MKTTLPALRESDIARTCSDFLMMDGWRMLITDPVSDRGRGKGFGELGMADRLYIRYGFSQPGMFNMAIPNADICHRSQCEVMWIEWKRIDGRGRTTQASAHQRAWIESERARGALVLLAGVDFPASINGFLHYYRNSGLARK